MDPLLELIIQSTIPAKTVEIKTKNGVSVYSMNKLSSGLAVVAFFIMLTIWVTPMFGVSRTVYQMVLAALFVLICIPLFIYQTVSKVYVSEDSIVYRNPAGRRTSLKWTDIRVAFITSRGLRLADKDKNLKIRSMFNGFYYIVQTAYKKCPRAFDVTSVLEHDRDYKEFATERNGTAVFKVKRYVAAFGFLCLLIAGVMALFTSVNFNTLNITSLTLIILIAALFLLMSVYLMLIAAVSRCRISNDMITSRNFTGKESTLSWDKITSVQVPVYSGSGSIILQGGDTSIKLGKYFSGFYAMEYIIAKRCKGVKR